jgi:hypothetical protein
MEDIFKHKRSISIFMNQNITENNYNRLATSLMEKHGCDYQTAVGKLHSFKLHILCGPKIRRSLPHQASLITAANAGKRAFLGGVSVCLPANVGDCLLSSFEGKGLRQVLIELGVELTDEEDSDGCSFILTIGVEAKPGDRSLQVICNSWQGGVSPMDNTATTLPDTGYLSLGGVAAGAIGVGLAFLIVSGIDERCADKPTGVSLWRPDLDWLAVESVGEPIDQLPQKLWLLGLGHLGQAYLWSLSLLPYPPSAKPQVLLQDFDNVIEANMSAGVLCEKKHIDIKKARVCAEWLERINYKTSITERRFNQHTVRDGEESFIALCGFDNALSRTYLEDAGFDLVIEAGIGGTLDCFDDFTLHTFPGASRKAADLWKSVEIEQVNKSVLKEVKKEDKERCGALYDALSKKAISTSFVGLLAGAFVIAEVLRAVNCQTRFEQVSIQLRCLKYLRAFPLGRYTIEAARNGTIVLS